MGSKGMGLQATALILEGTLVTEYIGKFLVAGSLLSVHVRT